VAAAPAATSEETIVSKTESHTDWRKHPAIAELIGALERAVGDKLAAVVLYGPAARGEMTREASDLHLLVLLADLELGTLSAASPAILKWIGRDLPIPRLFCPATLGEAADVFPIELSDVADHHLVLHGTDPLATMPDIDPEHLRLQCERELREKLMRLQEAFIVAKGREKDLARLMATSFPAFTMIFGGCLRLHGDPMPEHSLEAAEAFCRSAGIDPAPLAAVDRLRRGEKDGLSVTELFTRYHQVLVQAVHAVDRFVPPSQSTTHKQAPPEASSTRSESV
jgi:predicted nucleotidyltransferase